MLLDRHQQPVRLDQLGEHVLEDVFHIPWIGNADAG
jgi:hypothetical protein